MDEAGGAWLATRIDLMTAATQTNASEYNRLRGAEMSARLDADAAHLELMKHRKLHVPVN